MAPYEPRNMPQAAPIAGSVPVAAEPDVPVAVVGPEGSPEAGGRVGARRGAALVLVSAASFGAMPIFAKMAYAGGMDVKTLLALRFSLAAVGMWLIWAWLSKRGEKGPALRSIPPLVAMGALGYVGQSFSYFTAVSLMSASATGLLLYTYPVVVTVLAWLIFRESMTRAKVAALGMSLVGALLVLGIFSWAGGGDIGTLNPQGVLWGLAASAVYSAYIIAGTRYAAGISPVFASAVIITSAALVYLAWGAATGELRTDFDAAALVWAGCIALISTILAIATFFAGLRTTGPSRASIISTVEPAMTVLLAALVLNDAISAGQLAGGALILGAVLVVQLGQGRIAASSVRSAEARRSAERVESAE